MLIVDPEKSKKIYAIERCKDGLIMRSACSILRLQVLSSSIIRVSETNRNTFDESPGVGILPQAPSEDWDFECIETDGNPVLCLHTADLTVQVNINSASIRFLNRNGDIILKEKDDHSHLLEEFSSYRTIIDEHTIIRKVETPDGIKDQIEYATQEFDKNLYHTTWFPVFDDDEKIFGLGQHEEGILNLHGTVQYLHQANLKIAVPVFLSSKGYGVLFSTGSPSIFSSIPGNTFFYTEAVPMFDYYFMYGPSLNTVVSHYRFLTGKASALPDWCYGYVQSQERYENQQEILEVAREMKRRQIDPDMLVLDWHSWAGELWGQKTFDPDRFPDPKGMINELHEMGIRFMISIWPMMYEDSPNYQEFAKEKLLLPATDVYDAFSEQGRKLYWKQAKDGLFCHGIDAWWCDSCEPFTPEWARSQKPVPQSMYQDFLQQAKMVMPIELGNAYGLYHAQGIYEGQKETAPDQPVVNLIRSGYTGIQRYGAILWSGDIYASWETLRRQIVEGLHLCASGIPYWTLDIGGFFVKNGKQWFWSGEYDEGLADLGYRELYVRWFQFGAFLPIFRSHGTDVRREPWQFGEPGTPFYEAILETIRIRKELKPYILATAHKVAEENASFIKMLCFDFPHDAHVWEITDQYLFGDEMMVCPVTKPMYYERHSVKLENIPKTRPVYLPAGCDWEDFYTHEIYTGGTYITAAADLFHIPVYLKKTHRSEMNRYDM